MTAALGRLPTLQAGAWVWDDVQLGAPWHRSVCGPARSVLRGGRRGARRPRDALAAGAGLRGLRRVALARG